jgi:hypothetical protein
MDNIDEIDPDAVLISAEDFPRNWKTLVQFMRNERAKDKTGIVLLKGDSFSYEEAAKAAHIGVNGIVSEKLDNISEVDRLQGILGRYNPVDNSRKSRRIIPGNADRISFVFTHPLKKIIVSGKVESISVSGMLFQPEQSVITEEILPGSILENCTLRIGEHLISPVSRLVRNDRILVITFTSISTHELTLLEHYISEQGLRERFLYEKNEKVKQ